MSELSASAAAFRNQAKTAEVIPRFRVQPQQPKEDPVELSDDDERAAKRYKVTVPEVRPAYLESDVRRVGTEAITNMHYVMQYLKKDGNQAGKTGKELEGYLSLGGPLPNDLIRLMRETSSIHYDPVTDIYAFRPKYNVRSSIQLLAFLEAQKTTTGLKVVELREGWPNCIEELDKLEKQGKVLLIRQKEDRPRTVWKSNVDYTHIDSDFQDIFRQVAVPGRAQLPKELESLGLKPTSVDPSTAINRSAKNEAKQKKPNKKLSKVTNTHMSGLADLGKRR